MAQTRAQKAAAKAKARKLAAPGGTDNPEAAAESAPVQSRSPKKADATTSVRTVVVASKITRGLYLQHYNPVSMDVRVVGGGVEKRVQPMRLPDKVRIKPAIVAMGMVPNYPIVSGFSITEGVPADFWRKFVEQNPGYEPITEGILRAFDTVADAIAYAKEHEALRTGLEPLNQEKDPRVGTSMNDNVGDVDIDDETPRPKNWDQRQAVK